VGDGTMLCPARDLSNVPHLKRIMFYIFSYIRQYLLNG